MRAGVALGSNLGERLANLRNARREIEKIPGVLPPVISSSIYETDPIGCEEDATKFFNAVIEFEYSGAPEELLRALASIERSLGRPGDHARNLSRSIDLDLLYFGDAVVKTAELELPHPRIFGREFVLRPLADIRPDLVLPNRTESIAELLRALPASEGVVRRDREW
jgi:2-amino-4-hydroxy-6-hydroxymethyldihydropteridine diphosphokinase